MAKSKNRKNIQPGDVFKALEKGEFEEFLPRLQEELNCKYNREILPYCFHVFMFCRNILIILLYLQRY